jgi:response regulator RpfG family c-di-GMP phosphodiesterase
MESRSAFETRASGTSEPERGGMRPKARILAVDDSPDALTILRQFLTAEGFEVITAGDVAPYDALCAKPASLAQLAHRVRALLAGSPHRDI